MIVNNFPDTQYRFENRTELTYLSFEIPLTVSFYIDCVDIGSTKLHQPA